MTSSLHGDVTAADAANDDDDDNDGCGGDSSGSGGGGVSFRTSVKQSSIRKCPRNSIQ